MNTTNHSRLSWPLAQATVSPACSPQACTCLNIGLLEFMADASSCTPCSMSVLAGGKSGVLISADMLAASAVKISFLPVKQSLAGQACTSGERYQQLHWTAQG